MKDLKSLDSSQPSQDEFEAWADEKLKTEKTVAQTKEKIALVIGGGGMLVSYVAGVVSALRKVIDLPQIDIIIAGSGGSGPASYLATEQLNDNLEKRVWTEDLATKEMINGWRLLNWMKPIFDTKYLVDNVMSEKIPLDTEKLAEIKTVVEVPAISEDGEIRYFSSKEDNENFLKAIQASHSVPFMTEKVSIDGTRYHDAFCVSHVYSNVVRAIEEHGATRVIAINCISFSDSILGREELIHQLIGKKGFSKKLKNLNDQLIEDHKACREGKYKDQILFIEPNKKADIGPFCVDGKKLWKRFLEGKEDAEEKMSELDGFLEHNEVLLAH